MRILSFLTRTRMFTYKIPNKPIKACLTRVTYHTSLSNRSIKISFNKSALTLTNSKLERLQYVWLVHISFLFLPSMF